MRRNSEGWMAAGASRCGEPVVFVSGSFIFQGFWMDVFFFSAGRFVFCPDSFLIEVVKH